jgi:hypothetical protein
MYMHSYVLPSRATKSGTVKWTQIDLYWQIDLYMCIYAFICITIKSYEPWNCEMDTYWFVWANKSMYLYMHSYILPSRATKSGTVK